MPKKINQTKQQQNTPDTPRKTAKQWVEEDNARFAEKRYDEALVAYKEAIHLAPNEAKFISNKGVLLQNMRRYQEALAAFEQATQVDPYYTYAWNGKAEVLFSLKRYEEAEEAQERLAQLKEEGYE